jgi:hypothetical protein
MTTGAACRLGAAERICVMPLKAFSRGRESLMHHQSFASPVCFPKLNFTCNNDSVYNNTFRASILSLNTNQKGNWNGTSLSNNAFPQGAVYTSGARISGNTKSVAGSVGAGSTKPHRIL